MKINVAISVGDFLDRLSILKIKSHYGLDVERELVQYYQQAEVLPMLSRQMYIDIFEEVNQQLWHLEEEKRQPLEGDDYKEVSDLITHLNDLRYQVKKSADKHFRSEIQEKKSHRSSNE